MHTWKSESNTFKQRIIVGAILILGIVLMVGFRNFDITEFSESLSGFILGTLLFVIAVLNIITELDQTITIDPALRQIIIENKKHFMGNLKKTTKIIPFDDIERQSVTELGSRNEGSPIYYITLYLKDDQTYPLFFPAYFEGRWSKTAVEEKQQYLERLINK